MTERIEKLCDLLEEIDEPSQNNISKSPGNAMQSKNVLKLALFRIEQRVDDIDRKVINIQENLKEPEDDKLLDNILNSKQAQGKPGALSRDLSKESSGGTVVPGTAEKQNRGVTGGPIGTSSGIKGMVSKHEYLINDMTLRVSEIENNMRQIDPGAMRVLIKDIAELVIQQEKKEVDEEMNSIKGSQKRSSQLVDLLKDELKNMDERFQRGIENKIEKKDLTETKNQLRRKVLLINQIKNTIVTRIGKKIKRKGY